MDRPVWWLRAPLGLLLLLIAAACGGGQEVPASGLPASPARRLQQASNVTSAGTSGLRVDMVIRFTGANFVPVNASLQQLMIQAFQTSLPPSRITMGLVSYREGFPDPAAPPKQREKAPYADLAVTLFHSGANATDQQLVQLLIIWQSKAAAMAKWGQPKDFMYIASFILQAGVLDRELILSPIVVLEVVLALDLSEGQGGTVSVEQASAASAALQDILVDEKLGTMVEVSSKNQTQVEQLLGSADGNATAAAPGQQLVLLEATVFMCPQDNGTAQGSPNCEANLLEQVLQEMLKSAASNWQLKEAGIQGGSVLLVRQRPVPSPPATTPSSGSKPQKWRPWHLDRMDQRQLPLDGSFSSNASGTGVHVYLLSTGVRPDHQELLYADRNGTRVVGAWGFEGMDPLEDCQSGPRWYGHGTYAASIIGGLTVGVAPNVTIHSVRYRQVCGFQSPLTWSLGGLLSAIDYVLENHISPAVMVIDGWWTRGQLAFDDDDYVESGLTRRLGECAASNITVVAWAGPGQPGIEPCDNVIARHPSVISVAPASSYDARTILGAWNSSCISIWAPGGGLGRGMVGAEPSATDNYINVIPTGLGAAWVTAGVAAQYLSLNPKANPKQVKQAILSRASTHTVTGAGRESTTSLLYTNFTEPPEGVAWPAETALGGAGDAGAGNADAATAASGEDGGGGLSTGALVGIIVGCVAGVALVAALGVWVVKRARQRRQQELTAPLPSDLVFGSDKIGEGDPEKALLGKPPPTSPDLLAGTEWEISGDQLEICRRSDGADWLLGEGAYGSVYRAVKGGVQPVAVKVLRHMDEDRRKKFVREMAMLKYLSRDPSITQFYGAVLRGGNLMLVVELMDGGDLRKALDSSAGRDYNWYRQGKGVALDFVRGLHFLHTNHVVHRDIKSRNIMLTREGRAKISDVGLARILEGAAQPSLEGFVGTFAWAAPELLMGARCSYKTDMYSAGVVLWELATGQAPSRGSLRKPQVPKECPQGVADAINACLQCDPTLRPTARDLYSMLLACPPHDQMDSAHSLILDASEESSGPSSAPSPPP